MARASGWKLALSSLGLGLGLLTVSVDAGAQVERSQRTKDGDFHEFRDDLLSGGVSFPRGGSIRVRPPAMRAQLIRPRASFVREMLKSVEHM